jgi:hypothetical protein
MAASTADSFVAQLAAATGVSQGDVTKVLSKLGLTRVLPEANQINNGKDPSVASARLAFRVGKNTIVI